MWMLIGLETGWNKQFPSEAENVYSRTGYVITYAGCPIVWASKLQPLIALSTTEAEFIALSTALREVIFLMNLLKELKEQGIPVPFTQPKVMCKVFEGNAACIEVAKEPKLQPCTKHMAVHLSTSVTMSCTRKSLLSTLQQKSRLQT